MSRKVTGKPIKFSHAEALRKKATNFAADPAIAAALSGISPSAKADTQTFYTNLDCAFVFDKDSLLMMMAKIMAVPDSGLVMMMGASDDAERLNKPTLSVFACTLTKTDLPGVDSTYSIIHPDPSKPDDTDGIEHPGLVNLTTSSTIGAGRIDKGVIAIFDL